MKPPISAGECPYTHHDQPLCQRLATNSKCQPPSAANTPLHKSHVCHLGDCRFTKKNCAHARTVSKMKAAKKSMIRVKAPLPQPSQCAIVPSTQSSSNMTGVTQYVPIGQHEAEYGEGSS